MSADTRTAGQRVAAAIVPVIAIAVLAFLVAPIAVVVPLSFSSGSFFHYPLPGFSLRWYEDFFTSAFWPRSVCGARASRSAAWFWRC